MTPAQQITSLPPPTPAPPVTAGAAEVVQASQDEAQQNLIKKSVKRTIFAGDTGGYSPGAGPSAGPNTSFKKTLG